MSPTPVACTYSKYLYLFFYNNASYFLDATFYMMAYSFVLADFKHLQLYLLADLNFKETV